MQAEQSKSEEPAAAAQTGASQAAPAAAQQASPQAPVSVPGSEVADQYEALYHRIGKDADLATINSAFTVRLVVLDAYLLSPIFL